MKILGNVNLETEFGAARIHKLADGRPGLRGAMNVTASTPADAGGAAIINFIASDDSLDRYDEVIEPRGWQLDNYRKNPVFQNAHNYWDVIFTLGKSLEVEVLEVAGRAALYQRIEFAVDANPMAKIAYNLYRGGFLNAVSVGFIPLTWEDGVQQSNDGQPAKPYRRKYLSQELLELSAVGIPANPNALQVGLKAGAITRSDVHDLVELLERALDAYAGRDGAPRRPLPPQDEFRSNQPGPGSHGGASTAGTYEAQLLQLARDASALVRSRA